jgi:hypothetical protein
MDNPSNISHKNFKGQMDDEFVICYFRKHWLILLPTVATIPVIFGLLMAGLFYLPFVNTKSVPVAAAVLAGFFLLHIAIHRQFFKIFYYFLHTVILTNHRIVEVDKSLFLRDSKNSIDISNVQDIEKKQSGIFQNLLNFGSLVVYLSGSSAPTVIDMIPRPEYQYKKINQAKADLMERGRYPNAVKKTEFSTFAEGVKTAG